MDNANVLTEPNLLTRFLRGLAEFFNPRDWVPSIPLPPIGSWEPKGKGTMTLWEALQGFPKDEKR